MIQSNFDTFVEAIQLPLKAVARIESARATLASFLISSYGLSLDQVFTQGSYANDTAIRPSGDGEYDVDVVAVCVPDDDVTSSMALDDLERRFAANGNYAPRVVRKDPCVRLEYQEDDIGKFHVDVVPTRQSNSDAPLDAPHRTRGWHGTAPREYTAWCKDQGHSYVRTVQMLKHWRNEQQPVREAIKSIVLQVLIAQAMPVGVSDDSDRIATTFQNLASLLTQYDTPPAILNPVLPSENLAATWPVEAFRNFKAEVIEARELSRLATAQTNTAQAASIWTMLFGEEFPAASSKDFGLKLGDHSHQQKASSRNWTESLDPRFRLTFSARVYRGFSSRHSRAYQSDGQPVFADDKIKFQARCHGPATGQVWWQVVNTGGHARAENGLRGEFFLAKSKVGSISSDPFVNWESSSYTGVHLIRPVLVIGNNVAAKAAWMRVNIVNLRRGFTL